MPPRGAIAIRPEATTDLDAIRAINVAAFAEHPFSEQTEHLIVDALRAAGALEVSLIAVAGGRIVGHVAFSRATVGGEHGWFLLGPVAVMPGLQRRGIGSALVRAGLDEIRTRAALGCVLVGDASFYGRFGFRSYPQLTYDAVPQVHVLGLPFGTAAPSGAIHAHEAFKTGQEQEGRP
jgi:putative acetyltransferase